MSIFKIPKVFYGWWMVAAACLIGGYIIGSMFMGFTAFFQPITDEFGWSYTEVSLGFSIRTISLGVFAPLVGILVDRLGPRKLLFGGAIVIATGLLLMSSTQTLTVFYISFFILAIGLGCCTMTVLMTAVAHWFHSKIGLASGIVTCGFGSGGLLIQVVIKLINDYGWRECLVILAIITLALCLPLSLLFRHKPEEYGYLPDGADTNTPSDIAQGKTASISGKRMFIKELLGNRSFWHLVVTFSIFHMMLISIESHVMPYLSSIGMTRSNAGFVATAIPLFGIIGSLGFGRLGDKIGRRKAAFYTYLLACLGIFAFATAPSLGIKALIPFLLLYGVGNGGCNAMRPSLTRDVFGRESFGTIFGSDPFGNDDDD